MPLNKETKPNQKLQVMETKRFFANGPQEAECLLHSLEQAAIGTCLFMNSDKILFMCFNQDCCISLNSNPLELIDPIQYLGSNISSSKIDFNIDLGKPWSFWQGGDRWKSDFFD